VRILVAGGGTGGHLFPGIAIADEVARRGGGQALFVGTSRGIETRAVPAAGYALETLEVSGIKRMGLLGTLRGLLRVPLALLRSYLVLRRWKPDVVVGVGGYASGPMVLAAALAGYPTAIQEQNSVPGFTNRVLGKLVRAVFIAFEDAARYFPSDKLARLGNPVRGKIVAALEGVATGAAPSHASSDSLRLLVVGGSQGARAVSELVAAAAPLLTEAGVAFSLVHQTGTADLEGMVERYRKLGLSGQVEVRAFIEDMAAAYAAADLVIARAGALTLAELAIAGKPAILIPLPTAADDHQSKNAGRFAEAGAALVLDQRKSTAADLTAAVKRLAADRGRMLAMTAAMRGLARPSAAQDIVDRLEDLSRGQ
jgi:UDP-N-acetylglucosamine--N-acetylmuramyl-(pentapeptide) pyrophosphoryl-undecaprenol N-acetylglucosamine transferase